MKKITHIGMAALVAMGMLGTSCNKAESPEIETPETQKDNIVTLTTTVGFAADDTKALTGTGVKTFAEDETMAIYYYKNKGDVREKAVSAPLTAGDITNGGKSATFTFTLDNPYKDMSVVYTYPAAMANADFTPNYDALYNNQDGTLETLGSNFDFCTGSHPWSGENLPSLTLENQLAILAITLKDEAGTSEITSSITGLTLSDGTNTYNVNRSAAAGPIYVAIRPTSDATITVTATSGTKNYAKTLTGKTYAKGNGYPVSWKMTDASVVNLEGVSEGAEINVSNGQTITGPLTDDEDYYTYATITIEDGAIVTLKNVVINPDGYLTYGSGISGITCDGNATIILEGTNTVKGFGRSGIEVKSGKTLTILGTGTLNASGYNDASGAGIGGEGNIVIMGGTINATGTSGAAGIGGDENGTCGNITISGGTVTATGGNKAAGIGSGYEGFCGNITISGGIVEATGGSDGSQYGAGIGSGAHCSIDNAISITITSGVTSVTATRGGDGDNCKFIGVGSGCSNGPTLTIDGVANATTSSTFPHFTSSVSGNTWTLTHK